MKDITFTRLDTFPGEYVHAEGETAAGAAVRVCVGPEFGTLGDADIKKAALEAVKGSKCDLLLVCAFAFEASVHEQTAELTKEIKLGKLELPAEQDEIESREKALGLIDLGPDAPRSMRDRGDEDMMDDFGDEDESVEAAPSAPKLAAPAQAPAPADAGPKKDESGEPS